MVSKVQAIGKKDVSLEEEKRAAGKTVTPNQEKTEMDKATAKDI